MRSRSQAEEIEGWAETAASDVHDDTYMQDL